MVKAPKRDEQTEVSLLVATVGISFVIGVSMNAKRLPAQIQC